jgi:hypothetical protein
MLRSTILKLVRKFGYELVHSDASGRERFPEATEVERAIMLEAAPFTLTSMERRWALTQAVNYIVRRQIPGAFVEAGVWRGGSAFVAARMLQELGETDREMWLYDTFEGMSAPTEEDVAAQTGAKAEVKFTATQTGEDSADWCRASLEDVRNTMSLSKYPADKLKYIVGKVEDTLAVPNQYPEQIALLRLDTDWYDSTRAEMEILFPRLVPGGVLIVDDYGHWQGAKKAVDEYFEKHGLHYLMSRIDYTGRMLLKV